MSRRWEMSAEDTITQQQRFAAPVLSGAVLAASPLDLQSFLFKSAVEASDDALAICACVAESPVIVYANPAFCALLGCEMVDLYGRRYDFMIVGNALRADQALLKEAVAARHSGAVTVRCMQRAGTECAVTVRMTPLQNAAGRTTHYLIALREIDEAQQRIEQLRFLAHHDALTGLPNRRLLLDRLDRALARYERHGEGFTVAFVDLDRFKEINDEFGHAVGDAVLKHVARCLSQSVRASDTVGRLGGDEFLLLLGGASTATEVNESLARVQTCLSETFAVGGRIIDVGCSIGIATCPRDGMAVADLLRHADSTMYRAKKHTRPAWTNDTDDAVNSSRPGRYPAAASI